MMRHYVRMIGAGVIALWCNLSLVACAVRYAVVEPESAHARLGSPVWIQINNETTPRPGDPIALRVHVSAPRDSALLVLLNPHAVTPDTLPLTTRELEKWMERRRKVGGTVEGLTSSACNDVKSTPLLITVCAPDNHTHFSSSVALATLRMKSRWNPFGINEPEKLIIDTLRTYVLIRPGRDTTFHVAVIIDDPAMDYQLSRYGLDVRWVTFVPDRGWETTIRERRQYERLGFNRINYWGAIGWVGLAAGVIWSATLR